MKEKELIQKFLITNLIESILNYDHEKLLYYLKLGVNPNYYQDWSKVRPIHFAIANNNSKAVQYLIQYDANPFLLDADGTSGIEIINEKTSIFIKKMLLNFYIRERVKYVSYN